MMKVKYYKCPLCSKKFKTLSGWAGHMDLTHPENRPNGFSDSRYFYYTVTGRTHGTCRTCKKDTEWNEVSMKYDQYCKNPECKKAYAKIAKQRMIGKYGKIHLLNDPNMQKKMLSNRKISGKYRFRDGTIFEYVGSYEHEFLKMMDLLMGWHSQDLMSPSPHVYYYDYKNDKDDPKNEGKKFYIPDFYIPSLNLEIEIKQQNSYNTKMDEINRIKEKLKDELMESNKDINYLKINNNDFTVFFDFLENARECIPTNNKDQMEKVMECSIENYVNNFDIPIDSELDKLIIPMANVDLDELINDVPEELVDENVIEPIPSISNGIDTANEGFLSFLSNKKDPKEFDHHSWREEFGLTKKGVLGGFFYSDVLVRNGMIEIRGINYTTLRNRIKKYYEDNSIFNIFLPKYNAISYRRYKKKKINRGQITIEYLYTPEFFALELVCMFNELGKRFRDNTYVAIATMIYENSWMQKADKDAEVTPLLNLDRLSNIKLELNDYQKEFISNYPKLKKQLNLEGYILAFEQGLGKTLTSISLSECLNKDHVYIICPNSLKENWALEIKKYYDKYSDDKVWKDEVFICNDKKMKFNENTTKFIITNNESIEKMFPYVMSGNNILIIDESHNFRNLKSKRVNQLLELKDKIKCSDTLVMSGTPIKATPDEIVPALLLIDPTFTEQAAVCFTKAFKLKSSLGLSLIQARFGKIIYRKEKDVLGDSIPPKHIEQYPVKINEGMKYSLQNVYSLAIKRYEEIYDNEMDEAFELKKPFLSTTKEFYPELDYKRFVECINVITGKHTGYLHEVDQTFIEDAMKEVTSRIKDRNRRNNYIHMIKKFVRFKAHCKGLALGEILPKYRTNMFLDMYDENRDDIHYAIKNHTKKTLIFTQFKKVANHINDDLNLHNIGSVLITGDVKDRMSVLRSFKDDDNIRVLVATSQTVGTGVTLIEASQMFFFGPPWRQSDFDQCSDRIHRIGQTDEVYIYNVTLDTGDEPNLSTRMDSILEWSKKMTEIAITKTEGIEDETNFEEILTAEEGYILNDDDIYYNRDKFDSGEINLCCITGLSGSGKTTMGKYMNSLNIEHYELDDVMYNKDKYTMRQLKEKGDLIYSFFNGVGKKYYVDTEYLKQHNVPGSEYEDKLFKDFMEYAKRYAESHKTKKFIIEGVWFFCKGESGEPYFQPEYFDDCAFYIKGTSMIKSRYRAVVRDSKYDIKNRNKFDFAKLTIKRLFNLDTLKWYKLDEKSLDTFRDYFRSLQYANESAKSKLESSKYISNDTNEIFKLVKKFNRDLNQWKYGVLINGKVVTKSSEIDWSNYKTIPINLIDKYHVGICWDFVNYQHWWFNKNRIKNSSYFFVMDRGRHSNDIVTHTFSIITIGSKKYWFESSWYKNQGVHEVLSYKDVIKQLVENYDKQNKNAYTVYEYNPNGLDRGLSNSEFFNKTTQKVVFDRPRKGYQ